MIGHTPGPWLWSHRQCDNGKFNTQVYTEDGETICTLHWYPRNYGIDAKGMQHTGTYREANARLIAAAPDYDTMARNLEKWWRLPNDERTIGAIEPVIREALDAIAKAEGQT